MTKKESVVFVPKGETKGMPRAVGVDVGTARLTISAWEGGRPVTAQDSWTIPSVVTVAGEGYRVGAAAKQGFVLRPQETLSAVKRLLGRAFSEAQDEVSRVPYVVEPGANDTSKIRVHGRLYTPEEIVALLLRYALDEVSRTLGEPVREVVLSVPATFTSPQRQALCDAAAIAGLQVVRLVHAATAAALAYGALRERSATVLVVDIGSSASEVALVDIERGVCEVRASSGDPHLGGDDFDQCLADHVLACVRQRYGIDIQPDLSAQQRLYEAVEQAKCELSSVSQTDLYLPHLFPQAERLGDIHLSVSRLGFEALIAPLLQRCARLIEDTLAAARASAEDIDDVVLVGGASRTPAVRAMVKQLTKGKEPVRDLDPDTAVAAGAAFLAGICNGQAEHLLVFEVMPLALVVEHQYGRRSLVIPRNSLLPCQATVFVPASVERQTAADFLLFQGPQGTERELTPIGRGRVSLEGIRSQPSPNSHLEVVFEYDINGILTVGARDRDSGVPYHASLVQPGTLSREEVELLKRVTAQRILAEQHRRETAWLRNTIDGLLHQIVRRLAAGGDRVALHERLRCAHLIEEARQAVKGEAGREVLLQVESDLRQMLSGLSAVAEAETERDAATQGDPPQREESERE